MKQFTIQKESFNVQSKNKALSLFSQNLAKKQLYLTQDFERAILPILPHLDLPKEDNVIITAACQRACNILKKANENPKASWFSLEIAEICEDENKSLTEVQKGFSNLSQLSKKHGGIGYNPNSITNRQKINTFEETE